MITVNITTGAARPVEVVHTFSVDPALEHLIPGIAAEQIKQFAQMVIDKDLPR